MAAQWPLIVAHLVELLPTLPGWDQVTVFDGPPITGDDPPSYATVGYVENDQAGTYTQVQDPDGFSRQEGGDVRSQLVCRTGDDDLAGMRTLLFSLVDALDDHIRADRRLDGVLSPQGTSELVVDVLSLQTETGTAQTAVIALHYTTIT